MRIGIDAVAVQSIWSQGRGIGRYARNLVSGLIDEGPEHEYRLYAHDRLPSDGLASAPNARIVTLPSQLNSLDQLALNNPDNLDALLMISPFEQEPWYDIPDRPLTGVPLFAVVYDMIPFLWQERYLNDPQTAPGCYRRLERLRRYDTLLAISEATRDDVLRLLQLPADRVVTIGGAAELDKFQPDRSELRGSPAEKTLNGLGIDRPFIFSLSGSDPRKNPLGLIDAYALLPDDLKAAHQLVITCFLRDETRAEILGRLAERGLTLGEVVLTEAVDEPTLLTLYQRCAAFAFPSKYEGLGLPLLEAMACGAPVIAGDNSSQPEVVGDAGFLVNAENSSELSSRLVEILRDPALAQTMGFLGQARASEFTWAASARRTLDAIAESKARSRRRPPSPRESSRRLAVLSPWPPKSSGVADYATRLVNALGEQYEIDLFHDNGYVPDIALGTGEYSCYHHRLFPRMARVKGYHGVLYQMGNSGYHEFLYDHLITHPGIVTLHDLNLAAFHYINVLRRDDALDAFHSEFAYSHPDLAQDILPRLGEIHKEPGGLPQAFPRRGIHMNRRVLAQSEAVIVHSDWCIGEVRRDMPEYAGKLTTVPLGAEPRVVSAAARAATRERFRLPADALLIGAFGYLTQAKMNAETIDAFVPVASRFPESLLIFAGSDCENGDARRQAEANGLVNRVLFLGRVSADDFADLTASVDVGVCLRRPPTYGETSAALLDLLRHGVATVVTDVATFSEYPDHVVRKLCWPEDGVDGLTRILLDLCGERASREWLGREAMRYVRDHHVWSLVASRYAAVIDRVAAARRPLSYPAVQTRRSSLIRSA